MSDVYVLGAGFSRAVSANMPTLRDLGEYFGVDDRLAPGGIDPAVLAAFHTPATDHTPANFNVELLMTLLALDQPFLDAEQNHANRSEFLRLSRGMASILGEAETAAVDGLLPDWLVPLIALWESDGSTVATFNYDTLIERAFLNGEKADATDEKPSRGHRSIYAAPIVPADARRGFTWTQGGGDAFPLLKLHGSLNWYYSGAAAFFGEPVYDHPVPAWGTPWADEVLERFIRLNLPDKVPLIIPPTTDKSPWLANELVRGQWLMFGNAVRSADRVICIGYSLPETDLLARLLLATSCFGRDVIVVDTSAECSAHFSDVLPGAKINSEFAGTDDAVERFVAAHVS